jgi:hypothetical protein
VAAAAAAASLYVCLLGARLTRIFPFAIVRPGAALKSSVWDTGILGGTMEEFVQLPYSCMEQACGDKLTGWLVTFSEQTGSIAACICAAAPERILGMARDDVTLWQWHLANTVVSTGNFS